MDQNPDPTGVSRAWMEAIETALQVLTQDQPSTERPPKPKTSKNRSSSSTTTNTPQQSRRRQPRNGSAKKVPNNNDYDSNRNDNFVVAWKKEQHQKWNDSAQQLTTLHKALWNMVPTDTPSAACSTALDVSPTEFPPGYTTPAPEKNTTRMDTMEDDHTNNTYPQNSFMGHEDEDAGDVILHQVSAPISAAVTASYHQHTTSTTTTSIMTIRRLLIRILTGQAEVWVAYGRWWPKASNPSSLPDRIGTWEHIAPLTEQAIPMGQQALELADAAVSLWWERQQEQLQHHQHTYQILVQDAETVALCVLALRAFHQSLLQSMDKARHKLESRLQPQWDARDQIKARMGDRWTSNPHPKGDYAERRRQDEKSLRALTNVLEKVQTWEVAQLSAGAQTLQYRLQTGGDGVQEDEYDWTMYYGQGGRDEVVLDSSSTTLTLDTKASDNQQRFNGYRPRDVSDRVPYNDYPDPTNFGWTFTGSVEQSKVEFFEKEMVDQGTDIDNFTTTRVCLDWYYTTATVKTSLVNPKHNENTQLFGDRVSPQMYGQILENPRNHTGKRYHSQKTSDSTTTRSRMITSNGKKPFRGKKKPQSRPQRRQRAPIPA